MFRKDLAFAMAVIALPAWGMAPTIELPTVGSHAFFVTTIAVRSG